MRWEAMTVDEYAAFQQACGAHVVKVQGTWWVEPRPFFFRPLFPLAEVSPELRNYPLRALAGGVLHPVPAGCSGNSFMHLFLYENPQGYSLDKLNSKHRQIVKKASEIFEARRMTDLALFVEQAAPIYQSFYDRTRYFYKKDRLRKNGFAQWARPLFEQPKVVIIGAYRNNTLAAVEILYQVEDVVIEDVYFSDSESQSLQVTDFMTHTVREQARSSEARCIFRGFPTGKKSLDNAKIIRGCSILKLPARFRFNPMALYLGKTFMNEAYRKLVAVTSFSDGSADQEAGVA